MVAAWDTTLASRIHPHSEVFDYVTDQAVAGDPVRIAAPALLEVAYGYQLRAAGDTRFQALLDWFTRFAAGTAVSVVPLDGRAALVAGRLRGHAPHPPRRSGTDRRSKTMRLASWLMDIEVAATAFAAGLDVATDNRTDFDSLADLLAALYPDAPPLSVVGAPY